MKIVLRTGLVLLMALACLSVWLWREASVFLNTPPESPGREIFFDVQPGANLSRIATELAAKGLVSDAGKFKLLARYKKMQGSLQAGRFLLSSGWKPERVLEELINGRPVLFRVTVPEGLTWWQTGRLLEAAGLVRFDDFRQVVSDPAFLRHYGIPFATAEGFLMPDTYLLRKPDAAADAVLDEKAAGQWRAQARSVAGRMVDNFWRKAASVWPAAPEEQANGRASKNASRPGPDDLKKWVILASIVEKETGCDSERERVAGVYENRLARSMLLQADPTVIYGLGPDFAGALRRVHLDDPANPYNTYQRRGLPPGPISSFGIAALRAAINPEKHGFIYFVAKTDGGMHTFSRTLEEHNRAVRAYRRQKREK